MLVPINEIQIMADAAHKSNFFGIKSQAQAMAIMLVAQADGTHPGKALQEYHIINDKPALKSEAMLARFLRAGGKVKWHEYSDKACKATFTHEQGGEVTVEWTVEKAKKIGLLRNLVWAQYPAPMMRSRVVSEGIRTVYPVITSGMYAPEELEGMKYTEATAPMIDVTPQHDFQSEWDDIQKKLLDDPLADLTEHAEAMEAMKAEAPSRYESVMQWIDKHNKETKNV